MFGPGLAQQPGQPQPFQQQQAFQPAFSITPEQKAQAEVNSILQTYTKMYEAQSAENRFRGCLYNKMDPKMSQAHKKIVSENVPLSIAGVPTDFNKWMSAVERNPSKAKLVTTQISSVAELKQRTQTVLKNVLDARKRLEGAKEQIVVV